MSFSPDLYKHELDKKAFDALSIFPKFVELKEAYIANVDEAADKINFLSTSIRLSENQFPEIYNSLPPICEKLGIDIPEIYYIKSEKMNAATGGSAHPFIFITSGLVEKLPADLIPTILAHECGHIACKHYLYHSMARELLGGIEKSPLSAIPAIKKYLTPALVRALLFWDRCSELSADRAAALCDGTSDKTIDALLTISGYKNIDRAEFLKQAQDLNAFVNDSASNRLIEKTLTQDESHPRLATRAYECYKWSTTAQFCGIINGTYTVKQRQEEENVAEEKEIVAAEITAESAVPEQPVNIDELNNALSKVNSELTRYTSHADKGDYALAIVSGILSGAIDAFFVGDVTITSDDIKLSHDGVNNFIKKYAKSRGFEGDDLKDAIGFLEKEFPVPQDNTWKQQGISVSAKNHHLADFAHHPTPLGLISSIVVQILRMGTFVNRNGEWHFCAVETTAKDIQETIIPAVITGILNWLVTIAETKYEQGEDREIPAALSKLIRLVASTPLLIQFAKCADNWFGHLISDIGGSRATAGNGMGISGVFISLLYEFASLPIMKDTGLLQVIDELYENHRFDLRYELSLCKAVGKQSIPVAFNEIYVRVSYFLAHLAVEIADHHDELSKINWNNVLPFRSRTVDRMLTVASMTFTVADTADAAIHAAIESGGNWVLFSGKFFTRFNYVGAGRAAIAVVKEISNENKETQLIHEKMILSEAKSAIFLSQLQEFKAQLEEKVSQYLVEDIEAFMCGFDYMNEGFKSGDSDLVIKGNVVIQRVLGREPQFTNQQEFDDLMESDIPLVL
jgi:hypothetical protein